MKTEIVTTCEASEIEAIILDFYGTEVRIVSMEELSNGSYKRVNVQKAELDFWAKESIQKLKDGGEPSFALRYILTDLCNQDRLAPGVYLIDVSW